MKGKYSSIHRFSTGPNRWSHRPSSVFLRSSATSLHPADSSLGAEGDGTTGINGEHVGLALGTPWLNWRRRACVVGWRQAAEQRQSQTLDMTTYHSYAGPRASDGTPGLLVRQHGRSNAVKGRAGAAGLLVN